MYLNINRISVKSILIILMIGFITNSCKVTQNYNRPSGMVADNLFRDVNTTDTTTLADITWKQMFTDTLLQHLIQEGIDNSPDLKIAMARINAAEANLRAGYTALYPSLDLHANVTDQKAANNINSLARYYQFSGSSSWEIDFWGKLRSTKKAAMSALQQSEAFKRAVQTQLVSDIATNYILLQAYDAQMKVTLKAIENRKLDVETMKQLKESDVVTGAAVVQSQANLYSAEVTIPDLIQNIRTTENALSILLGRSPGNIIRDSLDKQQLRTELQTGIPLQLLSHRPDVQQAEYQLRYYFELTNIAKSYFYPSLNITANGGFSNGSISQLFNASSLFGNIVGGLTQPVLNQGLNKQRLRISKAQQEEYVSLFKKTILNAGQEVSNALSGYQTATDKIKIRSLEIDYLKKSVDYTKELLKYTANTNYTDVLTSEQSYLAAELNSISDKVQQLQSIVALYRSLGGGWK